MNASSPIHVSCDAQADRGLGWTCVKNCECRPAGGIRFSPKSTAIAARTVKRLPTRADRTVMLQRDLAHRSSNAGRHRCGRHGRLHVVAVATARRRARACRQSRHRRAGRQPRSCAVLRSAPVAQGHDELRQLPQPGARLVGWPADRGRLRHADARPRHADDREHRLQPHPDVGWPQGQRSKTRRSARSRPPAK